MTRLGAAERLHKHAPGALADMVSNLVKNWEKEASYKTQPEDWRTIDHRCYQCVTLEGVEGMIKRKLLHSVNFSFRARHSFKACLAFGANASAEPGLQAY